RKQDQAVTFVRLKGAAESSVDSAQPLGDGFRPGLPAVRLVDVPVNPGGDDVPVRAWKVEGARNARESDQHAPLRLSTLLPLHKLVRRPFQRPARLGPPQYDFFDLLREGEILVGDAAFGVRLELHPELAPGDGKV